MEFGDYQGLSLNGFSQTTPYIGTLDGVTPANLLSNPFPTGLLAPVGEVQAEQLMLVKTSMPFFETAPVLTSSNGRQTCNTNLATLCCKQPTSAIMVSSCCTAKRLN